MRVFKIETFDSASRMAKFINEMEEDKVKDIQIVQIVSRRIADICNVYDLCYWEITKKRTKRCK